jgi:hypothetical protein
MNPKYALVSNAQAREKTGNYLPYTARYTRLAIASFVLAVFIVLSGFGMYQLTAWNVEDFTIKIPVDLPMQPIPEPELPIFLMNASDFFDKILKNQVPEEDLIVTSDVINGLISQSDYLRGHMRVELAPNRLTVKTSLPTDFLPGGKRRFFVSEHLVEMHQVLSDDSMQVHNFPWNDDANDEFQNQWRALPPVITNNSRIDYMAGLFGTTVDLDTLLSRLDRPLGDMRLYLSNLFEMNCFEGFLGSLLVFGKDWTFFRKWKGTDILKIIYNDPNTPKILHLGIERIQFEKDRMIVQPRGRSFHTKLGGGERAFLWMYSTVASI